MDVALRQARIRNPNEPRPLLKLRDGRRAGVSHRRLNAADKLVDDLADGPLEWHLALYAFGHELEVILDVLLEVAVCGSTSHCADGAHPTVSLIGPALVQEGLAGRLLRPREQRAHHDR